MFENCQDNTMGDQQRSSVDLLLNFKGECMKEIENSGYFITRCGSVYNRKMKKLSLIKEKKGYLTVKIFFERGKYKWQKVHRLVAKAYIENPLNLPFVNHKNGVKDDNRVENLEWVTNEENIAHAVNILQAQKGDKATKLTINSEKAIKVCEMLQDGMRNIDIAATLEIPANIVRDIRMRKSWTHLSKDYVFFSSRNRKRSTISRKT